MPQSPSGQTQNNVTRKKISPCSVEAKSPWASSAPAVVAQVAEYRAALERLFPDSNLEDLKHMPREQLLNQIYLKPSSGRALIHPKRVIDGLKPTSIESPESTELEEIDFEVSDDVNSLSLNSRKPRSYLGISSVHAIFKLIFILSPQSVPDHEGSTYDDIGREDTSLPPQRPGNSSQVVSPKPLQPKLRASSIKSGSSHALTPESDCITAYFTYFHLLVPIVDEPSFRAAYASGHRKDREWLSLLNIICALGSIAATNTQDKSHCVYYARCKKYLGLECLGSPHLETIQTLGLMSGLYLHYISQPNLAYSLMGAVQRMALAHGFHEDLDSRKHSVDFKNCLQIRRRVWWSLFCMDTWACGPLDRPGIDRRGPTNTNIDLLSRGEERNVLEVLPLLENVRFCQIATKIQEAVAATSIISHVERRRLNQELQDWFDNLPSILKDYQPCSESICVTRTVMRWRYFNQCLLLHRPSLLDYAIRRIPSFALSKYERSSIQECRRYAKETIEDIVSTPFVNQSTGWNGVWLLFQAVCVPLLGCFLADATTDDPLASLESCHSQIKLAIEYLVRMKSWSPAATRTLLVISRILSASEKARARLSSRPPLLLSDAETAEINLNTTALSLQVSARNDHILLRANSLSLDQNENNQQPHQLMRFSYLSDIPPPNDVPFTEVLAGEYSNEPMIQNFWDYLHAADNNMMLDLPFSEYQGTGRIEPHEMDFEPLWDQVRFDDSEMVWDDTDLNFLQSLVGSNESELS
ncbi:C6 transcription factor [Penicillium maclennaniae]|uniref:C6 transcription factor n=1 Tax=Penicillium maclennaniae TaxID=1343394 RepID=UPI00254195F5|nr:C6 transcription factor [Penicillium maclennaniae]KAJ5665443.1 C6 transcription factor [Penicillium maclennaniae]